MASMVPYAVTTGGLTTTGITRQQRTYNSGWSAWSNTAITTTVTEGEVQHVNGMKTVGYKKLLREGKFVKSTGYSNMVERWTAHDGSYLLTTRKAPAYTVPQYQYRYVFTGTSDVTSKGNTSGTSELTYKVPVQPDIADCGDEPNNLVLVALANVRSEQFDLSTQLAELKDLPRLLRSLGSIVADLRSAFKRGSISHEEFRRLFDVPGHWLSFRYGIMPIVLSIEDVLKQLAQREKFRHYADSATGSLSETYVVDEFNKQTSQYSSFHRHTVEKSYSIRGCARLFYSDGRPAMVSDFLVTSWELVPLSFVIDWVLNVGKVLASRSVINGASDYDLSTNFYCTVKNQYESAMSQDSPDKTLEFTRAWDVEYIYKLRQVQAFRPSISVDYDMNWMRYADALALSIKLLASKR